MSCSFLYVIITFDMCLMQKETKNWKFAGRESLRAKNYNIAFPIGGKMSLRHINFVHRLKAIMPKCKSNHSDAKHFCFPSLMSVHSGP